MALKNLIRFLMTGRPDRYPRICPGRRHAPVLKKGDCIYRIGVEPKDLFGRFGRKRPSNGRRVEASGKDIFAVARNGNCPNGAAVTAELPARRSGGQQSGNDNGAKSETQSHRKAGNPEKAANYSVRIVEPGKGIADRPNLFVWRYDRLGRPFRCCLHPRRTLSLRTFRGRAARSGVDRPCPSLRLQLTFAFGCCSPGIYSGRT